MNSKFATASNFFPSISGSTFHTTNKTNKHSSFNKTYGPQSFYHANNSFNKFSSKIKLYKKRPISPESRELSKATTDDTLFGMNEINIIDGKVRKKTSYHQSLWKVKPNNNIYGINATRNKQDILNVKLKVRMKSEWDENELRNEIKKKKYFPIENVETMMQSNFIMKNMNKKKESEKIRNKKYSSSKIDLNTFSIQNKKIYLNNILIDLLKGEREKIATKEEAVSTALALAQDELRNDIKDFLNYMEDEKQSRNKHDLFLNMKYKENKLLLETTKQLNQEYRRTQDEIDKTIRNILQYKEYADFVHKVMGMEDEVSNVDLSNIKLLGNESDFENNILTITKEFAFLLGNKYQNYEPEILKNPLLMNENFTQMEANILNYMNINDEASSDVYKSGLENKKIIEEIKKKEDNCIKEYKEFNSEWNKKMEMLNSESKRFQEVMEENIGNIRQLYEIICEKEFKGNAVFVLINECIMEILETLNVKENIINDYIEEMEIIQGDNDNANVEFKKIVDRRKNFNKNEKYKKGKEKLKKLEEEKKIKVQQRMYRYKIHGPIVYPPPNVLMNKHRQDKDKYKTKVNEFEMLYYD